MKETVAGNTVVARAAQKQQTRLHLAFLDGMRGFAAFYVLLFHVIANGEDQLTSDTLAINFLRFGHEAVVIFIVLSGFVLSLPVARSPHLALSGGLSGFFKRRGRRILPAYYAALFIMPLFFLAVELLKQVTGEGADWQRIQGMFISADMLSHLFLVHNLSPAWVASINPVLWSLATEWWIYFVFALVLLPVWRWYGLAKAVAVGILLSLIPTAMQLLDWPTLVGGPHLLGAFVLGMAGATWLYSEKYGSLFVSRRNLLGLITFLLFLAFCVIAVVWPSIRLDSDTLWVTDFLLAMACTLFILLIASAVLIEPDHKGPTAVTTRILESRPFTFLGQFSYSLYLTHLVVWAVLGITLELAPVKQFVNFSFDSMAARIFVLIPLLLITAYGFYLIFEKPFLQQRNEQSALQSQKAYSQES